MGVVNAAVRRTQMETSLDIELAWGGYYASTDPENGSITVFRLLDFNRDAYHAALFKERFDEMPTLADMTALSPLIGHAPIDARGMVRHENLQFLGSNPLLREDLEGYAYYLEAHEVTAYDIEELFGRILGFSTESPLQLRLELINDELVISQR